MTAWLSEDSPPAGRFDRSFGERGKVAIGENGGVTALTTDTHNRVVIGAAINGNNAAYRAAIVRLNIDGTRDSSFADDGEYLLTPEADVGSTFEQVRSIEVLDSDDFLVVSEGNSRIQGSGYSSSFVTAIRLNDDGTLDSGYADSGRFVAATAYNADLDDFSYVTFSRSQPGGGFVFHSNEQSGGSIPASTDCVVDSSGSDHLIADQALGGAATFIQDDGRIVFTASPFVNSKIYRANADGSPDLSFPQTNVNGNVQAQQRDRSLLIFEVAGGRQKKTVLRIIRLFPEAGPLGEVDSKNVFAARPAAVRFDVTYRSDSAINNSTVGSGDIRVRLPNGAAKSATLESKTVLPDGRVHATYRLTSPGGFTAADNGIYAIRLLEGAVTDSAGDPARGRQIGSFLVRVA